ncbi:hypothetical protein A3K89_17425 [Rhodococcoides kyotonense]|uniref:Uncharacterized protein n=1 Tax=Rhodococcoides kyotonense TaxID=398843 RepID=A0A177YM00_9NOCA|nr:hypothetical protein A3K89_17425 [Rhodococcus kyotonensis]
MVQVYLTEKQYPCLMIHTLLRQFMKLNFEQASIGLNVRFRCPSVCSIPIVSFEAQFLSPLRMHL